MNCAFVGDLDIYQFKGTTWHVRIRKTLPHTLYCSYDNILLDRKYLLGSCTPRAGFRSSPTKT